MRLGTIWRRGWTKAFNSPWVKYKCRNCGCRAAVILLAVLSLTVSVATRYCALVRYDAHAPQFATSHSPDAKRQHLLNDGLHWSAPAAAFVFFEPTGAFSGFLPEIPPMARFYLENCLYDRPPPSC